MPRICPNCQGPVEVRNPTGSCDHLYWPEYLTPEARQRVETHTENNPGDFADDADPELVGF